MHNIKEFDITKLDENMIYEVIKNIKIDDIINFCIISKQINMLFQKQDIKNIIIYKLPVDSLYCNDFTLKQLYFYDKVLPLKNKILNISNMDIFVNINQKIIRINYRIFEHIEIINSNQIIPYKYGFKEFIVLENNDKICLYNNETKEKKYTNIDIDGRILSIENEKNNGINIITNLGKFYVYKIDDKNLTQILEISNIIQKIGSFILTVEGKLYYTPKFFKRESIKTIQIKNLPKIVQLTYLGYCLAANGDVYNTANINEVIKLPINNIVQIRSTVVQKKDSNSPSYIVSCLDTNGNVFIVINNYKIIKIDQLSDIIEICFNNIIEICFNKLKLIALDKNLKLHILDENLKLHILDDDFIWLNNFKLNSSNDDFIYLKSYDLKNL